MCDFVYFALDLVQELKIKDAFEDLKKILDTTENQTLILRVLEVVKELDMLGNIDKNIILQKLTDNNIKAVAEQLFN